MKKKIVFIVVAAAVAAAAWMFLHKSKFLYAGTVEATEVDLSARVPAVIESVAVDEGDAVKNGQTLVRLGGEDLVIAAENAARDFERATRLHKSGSMSDEAFDKIRFRRDDTALRVDWLTIESPLDGTVLNRYHEPGEWVSPGTKLLTLADLSEVWMMVYVPQPMLAHLHLGASVQAYLPESEMKEFTGRITHISDRAEFTPKNVQTREERTRLVYGIKISFDNKERILKPGMTLEAKLPDENARSRNE